METVEVIKIDYNEIKYPVAEKAIGKLIAEYTKLTIEGIDDREGYASVDSARKDLKSKRVAIEHKRKELNEDARKYINAVNGEAKRLTDMITPIESRLKDMTDEIDSEKARIKKEKEEAEMRKLMERINRLSGMAHGQTSEGIKEMNDEDFESFFEAVKSLHDEEQKKKEEEARIKREEEARIEAEFLAEKKRIEAERAAEQKKIEAERAAMEAEKRKLEEERAAMEAEKRKIQAEVDLMKREKELEEARVIAAEKAKKEEQERLIQELEYKKLIEAEEIQRKKREEDLKPDKEKILNLLDMVWSVEIPQVKNEDSHSLIISFLNDLKILTDKYKSKTEKL